MMKKLSPLISTLGQSFGIRSASQGAVQLASLQTGMNLVAQSSVSTMTSRTSELGLASSSSVLHGLSTSPLRAKTRPTTQLLTSSRAFASHQHAIERPSTSGRTENGPVSTSNDSEQGLLLSDNAVRRMEELRAACKDPSEAQAIALRLLVDPGGCSGFQYKFELTTIDTLEAEDQVLKKGSLTLLCDKVSLELLKGATVDYQEDLMRAAFVVNDNPNAGSSCGCGSSFSVKS